MVSDFTERMPGSRQRVFALCVLFMGLIFAGISGAAQVSASLDRESVPAGEGAMLTLQITDGDAKEPQVPQVKDLIIKRGGRGRQMSFNNGQMFSATTFSYIVGSMTPGEYTIPPFTVTVDGEVFKTGALKLNVTPSANQVPQGMTQPNAGQAPPAADPNEDPAGFLTVELVPRERKHTWVGEIAPVRIRAWVPSNVRASLTSGLQPAPGFTLHNVSDKPQQTAEVRNGKQYTVITWYGGLSAAKAGNVHPELTIKARVAVPANDGRPPRRRSRFGPDPFDDPFADLFARVVQKDVVFSSRKAEDEAIEVRSLPVKGRPAEFNGAVGTFALDSVVIPEDWKTGEPQEIQAEISGKGNFNLLSQPGIHPAGEWKTYDGHAEFTAKDVASFEGAQTFHFNAMPKKSGQQSLSLEFSYFDPDKGEYVTVKSPEKKVEVFGIDLVEASPAPSEPAPKKEEADGLASLHESDGRVAGLTPFAWTPAFRTLLGGAGFAVLAGLAIGRLRVKYTDPERRAREAEDSALRAALHEADTMAARGDVPGFMAAARRALQGRLASMWGMHAPAITLADVVGRVPEDSPVVALFREADLFTYGPGVPHDRDALPQWRELLRNAMNSLPSRVQA